MMREDIYLSKIKINEYIYISNEWVKYEESNYRNLNMIKNKNKIRHEWRKKIMRKYIDSFKWIMIQEYRNERMERDNKREKKNIYWNEKNRGKGEREKDEKDERWGREKWERAETKDYEKKKDERGEWKVRKDIKNWEKREMMEILDKYSLYLRNTED